MPAGSSRGVLDDEPGPAGQRAPDAERGREPVAALDRPVARAQQAERRARPGGQHQVARQRRAVPLEQPDGLALGHARAAGPRSSRRTPFEVWQAAHSSIASCSTSLMTRSPSPASMSRSSAFSTEPGRAGQPAQLVDEERRRVDQRRGRRTSSSRRRRPGSRPDALVGEDLGERPRPVARLARQAQVLEAVAAHRQRRGAGHPVALVADQDRRLAGRADDEQRLLEARVEAGQVREVRAVLAVGVDDEPVVAARRSPGRAGAARRSA